MLNVATPDSPSLVSNYLRIKLKIPFQKPWTRISI
jgi:hypothetical protein